MSYVCSDCAQSTSGRCAKHSSFTIQASAPLPSGSESQAECWECGSTDIRGVHMGSAYSHLCGGCGNRFNLRASAASLAPSGDRQEVGRLRAAATNALAFMERNECHHEETHRGGTIWTICDECGAQWADDCAFKGYREPKEITALRAALAAEKGK